ncbi:hypothetical protein J7J84_02710 [bacterium]|nr:hypothetical protein [bacterium]
MSEHSRRRNPLHSLIALSALFLLATALIACGGGGPGRYPGELLQAEDQRLPPPPDDGAEPPQEESSPEEQLSSYLSDQASGLQAWPSSTLGALSGTVSITGYTLIDPQSLEPIPPEQGLVDVPLRVVDPEDDIDSVTLPDAQGNFLFPDLPPTTSATLSVQFVVAEDVDGDGYGFDPIECKLPVRIMAARITSIQLDISPLEPLHYEQLGQPPDIFSTTPISFNYGYQGPDGDRQQSLAILRSLGRVWLDSDLDGEFSPDDLQFADENANGLGDETEDYLAGVVGPPTEERVVFGSILSVVGNVITIYSFEDTVSIEIALNEGTILIAETGEELPLTRHLVGKDAVAVAQEYRDGHISASLIMVLPETYSHGPGGR